MKTRTKTIEGIEYVLPPKVCWLEKRKEFVVQLIKNKIRTTKGFSVNSNGSVEEAFKLACEFSQLKFTLPTLPFFKLIKTDSAGRTISFGKGIYLQTNKSRYNYQLLMVLYGSAYKNNLKKEFIALGREGHYSEAEFNLKLELAKTTLHLWKLQDQISKLTSNNRQRLKAA